MSERTRALTLCMLCPSPCRRVWPAAESDQSEAITPSALAMVAVMLGRGAIVPSADVAAALGRTAMAKTCRAACPYDFDIAGHVEAVLGEALARAGAPHA